MPFRRRGDELLLDLPEHEARLLGDLVAQLVTVLEGGDPGDPAVARLLPSAYPDDEEAAAEFRRFTSDDLIARKLANARRVLDDVAAPTAERLDAAGQQSWLRTLTDLRLVLGSRLGVTADGPAPSDDPHVVVMHDVFDWLGYLQESLVQTLG
ncbi:DUF2017 domain-containing protein [Frigoribacterium sp. CFBP 13729]|uniref:DUF2017 domain-containing protein n=1 Tax=Frigoribacterium sp. CFBP 13729 TaxID=2775293 RepID=UPI00177CA101|nr:DUF2017 domain-containing protein [Frigoribacterium sp. CFBP 13729]MBD8610228.1 DUF2017 domain-containing protein [Frigoribacterium sp. CFBP 13729]